MMTRRAPNEEIELKLAMDGETLQRLPQTALLHSLQMDLARAKKLASTYYDTPDLRLKQAGMALRVRHDGAGYVQTLKAPRLDHNGQPRSGSDGGLQHLREFDAELDTPEPDLGRIQDPALQAFFSEAGIARDLEPIFTTDIERQVLPLELADSRVELAIDRGRIAANGSELPVAEAELELHRGEPGKLYELAMMLHREVPFHVERASKAARGYGLYSGVRPSPQKARKPALEPGMTVAGAFERQAQACLWQMRANEEPVVDGTDPEGVHQMRVAIRRLRALVTAFSAAIDADVAAYLKTELRWMQRQLGPARDLDVFLADTLAPLRQRLPATDSLARLADAAESLRTEAYADARRAVRDPRYTALLLRLELWLNSGAWQKAVGPDETDPAAQLVTPFAQDILARRAKKFKKLGKKYDRLGESDLHELRIRGKKLRYAGEFFTGLFKRKDTKAYLDALEEIQDRLGAINDAATGQELLDRIDARMRERGESAADTANAAGLVQGWQVARIDRELRDFAQVWQRFGKLKPFWR